MASAWNKPLVVREPTATEKKEALAAAGAKLAAEAARALHQRASELVRLIDASYVTRSGGVSAKYGMDEQYQVRGEWSDAESDLALVLWRAAHAGGGGALHLHRTHRQQKTSGGRDGIWQWNFIRNIAGAGAGRYNVHVNWSGKA